MSKRESCWPPSHSNSHLFSVVSVVSWTVLIAGLFCLELVIFSTAVILDSSWNDSLGWFTATLHGRKGRISDPNCNDCLKIEQFDLLQEIYKDHIVLPLYRQSATGFSRAFFTRTEPSRLNCSCYQIVCHILLFKFLNMKGYWNIDCVQRFGIRWQTVKCRAVELLCGTSRASFSRHWVVARPDLCRQ